jgi:hypothetical protein
MRMAGVGADSLLQDGNSASFGSAALSEGSLRGMSYEAVAALCAHHQLRSSIHRITTEDGHRRWEIRAVSITGSESWRVEADELIDAVRLLE